MRCVWTVLYFSERFDLDVVVLFFNTIGDFEMSARDVDYRLCIIQMLGCLGGALSAFEIRLVDYDQQ